MSIDTRPFKVREGDEVGLGRWAAKTNALCKSKKAYRKLQQDQVKQLSDQQRLLYASNRRALLVIFQAMDTAAKDGVIRHVMSGINLQGCQVFGFRHTSAKELQHDFLWPTTRDLPERGRIGIFNRSYSEESGKRAVGKDSSRAGFGASPPRWPIPGSPRGGDGRDRGVALQRSTARTT